MTINYVSIDQAGMLYCKITKTNNPTYLARSNVEFVLSFVEEMYENPDTVEAVIGKSAYLWHKIASNQWFADANKRTGYELGRLFLEINGFTLMATEDDKMAVSKLIATNIYEIDHLIVWIRKSLKKGLNNN